MSDQLTVVGIAGTNPEHKIAASGTARTTFRLASTKRRQNAQGGWEDVHTNWYTVTCFRTLAKNVANTVCSGQRVIVQGRLQISDFQRDDQSHGKRVEIVANAVGPDLNYTAATVEARQRESSETDSTPVSAPEADADSASADAWAPAPVGEELVATPF